MQPNVLLLNASWQPLKIISWQKAIELWFRDKAEIVKEYSDSILKSVKFSMNFPAVIRLKTYVRQFAKPRLVKFGRLNVYERDGFRCAYCGETFPFKKLTMDHVLPRSRGGKTSWTNIVTACRDCNFIKADMTPEEARMKLLFHPYEPKSSMLNLFSARSANLPEEWKPFVK